MCFDCKLQKISISISIQKISIIIGVAMWVGNWILPAHYPTQTFSTSSPQL